MQKVLLLGYGIGIQGEIIRISVMAEMFVIKREADLKSGFSRDRNQSGDRSGLKW